MKKQKLLAEKKRQEILRELEKNPKKFVELKRILKLESNLLSYNLNLLQKEGMIQKDNLYFELTDKGRYLMPYVRKDNDASKLPIVCVATIIRSNGKILIRKKIREPIKEREIFIGGKIEIGEDIFDACKRHVKEKVNIDIKDMKIICINNYLSKKDSQIAHYVVFFVTAKPEKNQVPENSMWKEIKKINGKMYPDNKFVIKEMLNNKKIKMINSLYDEKKDRFRVVNIY